MGKTVREIALLESVYAPRMHVMPASKSHIMARIERVSSQSSRPGVHGHTKLLLGTVVSQ